MRSAKVVSRGCSGPLQRAIVDFAADQPFALARAKLREHYGFEIGESTIQRVTLGHAGNMFEAGKISLDFPEAPGRHKDIVAETDGGMIPIVEPDARQKDKRKGKTLSWREAKISLAHAKGSRTPIYAGAIEGGVETAGRQLLGCAVRAGFGADSRVHAVGDGAAWIVGQVEAQFGPQGGYLIDFYHVCEYLSAAVKAIAPDAAAKEAWMEAQKEALKTGHLEKTLQALARHLEPPQLADDQAPVRTCHRYLSGRKNQLDYRDALARDLPIGSGEIESAHRYSTEAPEAARSLVARRARRRHARPARHPYQRRLGRLLEQARPKQLARKSKPPLPITKIRSMIASLWIAPLGGPTAREIEKRAGGERVLLRRQEGDHRRRLPEFENAAGGKDVGRVTGSAPLSYGRPRPEARPAAASTIEASHRGPGALARPTSCELWPLSPLSLAVAALAQLFPAGSRSWRCNRIARARHLRVFKRVSPPKRIGQMRATSRLSNASRRATVMPAETTTLDDIERRHRRSAAGAEGPRTWNAPTSRKRAGRKEVARKRRIRRRCRTNGFRRRKPRERRNPGAVDRTQREDSGMATGLYLLQDGTIMVAYGARKIPLSPAQYKANGYRPPCEKLKVKPSSADKAQRAESRPRDRRLAHS